MSSSDMVTLLLVTANIKKHMKTELGTTKASANVQLPTLIYYNSQNLTAQTGIIIFIWKKEHTYIGDFSTC